MNRNKEYKSKTNRISLRRPKKIKKLSENKIAIFPFLLL